MVISKNEWLKYTLNISIIQIEKKIKVEFKTQNMDHRLRTDIPHKE
jgi:hypothetical protein